MSDSKFNLEEYLSNGVENIIKGAIKASISNPKESIFIAKFAAYAKKASKIRHEQEKMGEHIPPFLIASITGSCNLHCEGCYSRAIDSCSDQEREGQLDGKSWGKIFAEAADLGIVFILLAGGEPLLRMDVIEEASKVKKVMFPVITNATLLKGKYFDIFDSNRNLLPVISIEGNRESTDSRRGNGVYSMIDKTMSALRDKNIIFGISITVTTQNLKEVFLEEFLGDMYKKGCRLVIYVEYVPAKENTDYLAPGDKERRYMDERLFVLRAKYEDMLFVSFPGDEKSSDGCLAAGRGFFHINSQGGAEPCSFSPYCDLNVKDVGVLGALHSGLFEKIRSSGLQEEFHDGACALYGKDDQVKNMMN